MFRAGWVLSRRCWRMIIFESWEHYSGKGIMVYELMKFGKRTRFSRI